MFSMSGHLAQRAAAANPKALPAGATGMRLLSPCPKQAINDGLASSNLVIHQLGTTEIERVVSDNRAILRVKIRQSLNDIVTAENLETANLDAVFQQENTVTKGLIVTGAGMTGLGNAAWGLLCWAKEASDLVNPVVRGWNQYQAAKSALGSDNFARSYVDNVLKAEKRELVEAMGFDPSAITMEQLDTAMEVADLIWSDSALQSNLTQFCKDYIAAQHLTEQAEMIGGAVFEILLTIILAAVTGGVGAVASLGSKARLMGKFRKVGDLLMEFAAASKKAKLDNKSKGVKANKGKSASFSDFEDGGNANTSVKAGDTSNLPEGSSITPKPNVIGLEPGKKGGWNKQLNSVLKPNSKYKVGDHLYETDTEGRVTKVTGKLNLIKHDRNTYQQTKAGKTNGIKDGLTDDEGGHLIASIFDGPGEQINYAAMDGNLNKGAWKSMEKDWADALKKDPPEIVDVEINVVYDEISKRPSKFDVFYEIDGEETMVTFMNRPGGVL